MCFWFRRDLSLRNGAGEPNLLCSQPIQIDRTHRSSRVPQLHHHVAEREIALPADKRGLRLILMSLDDHGAIRPIHPSMDAPTRA